MDGIQPHLGMSAPGSLHSPTSSSYMAPPSNHTHHNSKSCVLDKEFIRNVDLPGLSVDDIEAVLSENEDWSGEQIDQFLRSAVDLSEIESKLFSLASYESDSGYSAYDVSPITSTAPANPNYQVSSLSTCPPPPLTLINQATSPLFGNPAFPGMPLPHHHTPSPLMHDAAISPCGSDGGFFSPHSSFANTPNQDTIVFFPPPPPPPPAASIYSHPYTQTPDFSSNSIFNSCFSDSASAIPNFSLQIPDIILHEVNTGSHLPPSLIPSADIKFASCSQEGRRSESCGEMSSAEKGDIPLVKEESSPRGCTFKDSSAKDVPQSGSDASKCPPPLLKAQLDSKLECTAAENHCAQGSAKTGHRLGTAAAQYRYSANLMGSLTKKGPKGGKAGTKGKRKTQWPRSMNRANLMAFREHILNKLKKAQDVTLEDPIHALAKQSDLDTKGASTSTSSSTPIKFEAPSPNAPFELQVTYERNHLAPPKRCHSEPARLQNMVPGSVPMQVSQSDGNLSGIRMVPPQYLGELKLMGSSTGQDCAEHYSDFNCNPNMFLSSSVDEKFLNDLELKFNMETSEEGEMFGLLGGCARPMHCPSSSTLSDVENMDMDCIQDLLDDSKQVFSPSSSVAASPVGGSPFGGDNHTPTGSASSSISLSRSDSISSVDKTPVCCSPEVESNSFTFPEILSIQGSMVLDGVSVLSDGETTSEYHQPQHAFLQSHHDPLLAADSIVTPPSWN